MDAEGGRGLSSPVMSVVSPPLWLPLVTGAVWAAVYAVRRWLPRAWLPLTRWPSPDSSAAHVVQSLPSVLLGAAVGVPSGDAALAVWGAAAGALAPLWHHALRALPGPYEGALRDAAQRVSDRIRDTLSSLLVVLGLGGCGAGLTPAQQLKRQACLARVESDWDRRAERECPPSEVYWDDCERATELERELAAAQRACSEGVRR